MDEGKNRVVFNIDDMFHPMRCNVQNCATRASEERKRIMHLAYSRLSDAIKFLYDADRDVQSCARVLEGARAKLAMAENVLLNQGETGPINGKNKEIREAQLHEMTISEQENVRAAKIKLDEANATRQAAELAKRLADLKVEELKWQIREDMVSLGYMDTGRL